MKTEREMEARRNNGKGLIRAKSVVFLKVSVLIDLLSIN